MFRKTVLATAIIGAGLGSMSGAAFAGDAPSNGGHHGDGGHGGGKHQSAPASSDGCSNKVGAESKNGAGRTLGDTTGGDQDLSASNLCNILSGNEVLSNNNVALLGGSVTNGDTLTATLTSTVSETTESTFG
jgi:hypothetical protein